MLRICISLQNVMKLLVKLCRKCLSIQSKGKYILLRTFRSNFECIFPRLSNAVRELKSKQIKRCLRSAFSFCTCCKGSHYEECTTTAVPTLLFAAAFTMQRSYCKLPCTSRAPWFVFMTLTQVEILSYVCVNIYTDCAQKT